jgi:hypothetical protein
VKSSIEIFFHSGIATSFDTWVDGDMRVCRYNEVSLHGKKTGLDNFMAIYEIGDESEDNKTRFYCMEKPTYT